MNIIIDMLILLTKKQKWDIHDFKKNDSYQFQICINNKMEKIF